MGFEIPGYKLGTQRAATALDNRYRFVVVNGSGQIAQAGAGVRATGVLQSPAAANDAAEVMVSGVSKVEAGAAITEGDDVTPDASGRAITAAAASGNTIVGTALESAGAAGEVIAVLLGYGGTA